MHAQAKMKTLSPHLSTCFDMTFLLCIPLKIVLAAQMAVQLQTSVVPCAAPAAAGREYVQTKMAVPNRNAKGEEEGVEWYFLQWW
jgi:hypothetical protein